MSINSKNNMLLHDFNQWYKTFINSDHHLVVAMKNTVEDSPYHGEDNVRLHTMMVVSEYIELVESEGRTWTNADLLGLMAATFHDVGKPRTEEELYSEKYGKVIRQYKGHEGCSASYWMDFWSNNEFGVKSLIPDVMDAYNIMVMIAYHLPYGMKSDKVKMLRTHLHHYGLTSSYANLLRADTLGRIQQDRQASVERTFSWVRNNGFDNIDCDVYNLKPVPDVHIMVGAPGSGKSTYVKNNYDNSAVVFSFDDVRELSFPELSTYHEKFTAFNEYDFSSDKRLHNVMGVPHTVSNSNAFLNHLMKTTYQQVKSMNGIYIVDNTTTTRKARRSAMNLIGSRDGYKAIAFFGSIDDIYKNNDKRKPYKVIPDHVIERMYFHYTPPILGEFDELEVIEINKE